MALSTWILGGLGWVLGGPIGAIIGAVIGSSIGESRSHSSTKNDVSVSLLVLIACVMKADGRVLKSEVSFIKPYLRKIYGEDGASDALKMLKQLLDKDIDYVSVCHQINQHINYSTRLELIHLLLELANADGDFDDREETLIRDMAREMKLQTSDYESLLALYQKARNADWAYTILEIEPTATDDEVKRAYRRMAMKYHPDKLTNASEQMREAAAEKFRAVHEAYEHIKTQRGSNV